MDRLFANIEPPPISDATWPNDCGKQRAPPELIVEDRDRDREQTRQRPPTEDREQTRQRPPAEDHERTRQRPVAEDHEQTRQRPSAEMNSALSPMTATKQSSAHPQRTEENNVLHQPSTLSKTVIVLDNVHPPLRTGGNRVHHKSSFLKNATPTAQDSVHQPQETGAGDAVPKSSSWTPETPSFTQPNTPRPTYGAAAMMHTALATSPTGSDDIAITNNRIQPPSPQHKPGLWAYIIGAARE